MGKLKQLSLVCLVALLAGCSDDLDGLKPYDRYPTAAREWVGIGPVNRWADQDPVKMCNDALRSGVNVIPIELLGWGRSPITGGPNAYETPECIREPYRRLLKETRKRRIMLFVSLVNDNKGHGKYGDDRKDLYYYRAQIRQARQIVLDAGPDGVAVQPVAETQTGEGNRFEAETIALCNQHGFATCWNHASRPTSPNGCTYFAYHPASTSDLGAPGGITVTDHSGILRQLNQGGNLYGCSDPAKIAAYAARVHAAGRGIVIYEFMCGAYSPEAMRALGEACK